MTFASPFILLTLSLSSLSSAFSQDTTYIDYTGNEVHSRQYADYCRVQVRTDSGWQVTGYTLARQPIVFKLEAR